MKVKQAGRAPLSEFDPGMLSRVLLAVALALAAGCAPPARVSRDIGPGASEVPRNFFLLRVDAYGAVENPIESERIAAVLAQGQIRRIIVMSYGWNNRPGEAEATYLDTLRLYSRTFSVSWDGILVIGVAWESGSGGVVRTVADILPLPDLAQTVGTRSDQVLLPLTFWSKGALADRVGYFGLRAELNRILSAVYPSVHLEIHNERSLYRGPRTSCEDGGRLRGVMGPLVEQLASSEGSVEETVYSPPTAAAPQPEQRRKCLDEQTTVPPIPDIYLVGHSFGTRILSGLTNEQLGGFTPVIEPFLGRGAVAGAVFFQPALSVLNVDPHATYPIVATMSRHDHANRFLYPLANVMLSAYVFTGMQAGRMTFAALWDSLTDPEDRSDPASARWYTPLIDVLSLPLVVAYSVATLPLDYGYDQIAAVLRGQPGIVGQILDTTGNLPLLEIPTDLAAAALDADWGRSRKGFLEMGGQRESVGGDLAIAIGANRTRAVDLGTWLSDGSGIEQEGLTVVDASSIVSEGLLGNLNQPLVDYTVGWIDPIGAHSDFLHPETLALIDCVIRRTAHRGPQATADSLCSESRQRVIGLPSELRAAP